MSRWWVPGRVGTHGGRGAWLNPLHNQPDQGTLGTQTLAALTPTGWGRPRRAFPGGCGCPPLRVRHRCGSWRTGERERDDGYDERTAGEVTVVVRAPNHENLGVVLPVRDPVPDGRDDPCGSVGGSGGAVLRVGAHVNTTTGPSLRRADRERKARQRAQATAPEVPPDDPRDVQPDAPRTGKAKARPGQGDLPEPKKTRGSPAPSVVWEDKPCDRCSKRPTGVTTFGSRLCATCGPWSVVETDDQ